MLIRPQHLAISSDILGWKTSTFRLKCISYVLVKHQPACTGNDLSMYNNSSSTLILGLGLLDEGSAMGTKLNGISTTTPELPRGCDELSVAVVTIGEATITGLDLGSAIETSGLR